MFVQFVGRTFNYFGVLHLSLLLAFGHGVLLWRWAMPAIKTESLLQLFVGRFLVSLLLFSGLFSMNLFGFQVGILLGYIVRFLVFDLQFYAIKIESELCFRGFCCSFWEFRCKTCANRRSSELFCLDHSQKCFDLTIERLVWVAKAI